MPHCLRRWDELVFPAVAGEGAGSQARSCVSVRADGEGKGRVSTGVARMGKGRVSTGGSYRERTCGARDGERTTLCVRVKRGSVNE